METREAVDLDSTDAAIVQLQLQQFRKMLEGAIGKGFQPVAGEL